jgi:hypothetical protein
MNVQACPDATPAGSYRYTGMLSYPWRPGPAETPLGKRGYPPKRVAKPELRNEGKFLAVRKQQQV